MSDTVRRSLDALIHRWNLRLLRSRNPYKRIRAAKRLGRLTDHRAVPVLIAALYDDDDDHRVRSEAAESLGKIRDARAIGPLIPLLLDGNEVMRREILKVLEAIEPEWTTTKDARDAVPFVLTRLDYEEETSLVDRREMIESMIITEKVRCAAIDILARIGDTRAVVPLLRKLENCTSRREYYCAIWAVGALRDPRAVQPLIEILLRGFRSKTSCYETSSEVQCSVLSALGNIGDKRAVEPLILALKKQPWDYCNELGHWSNVSRICEAVRALAKIGDPRAIPPLRELFMGDPEGCYGVPDALVKLRDPRGVALLEEASAEHWDSKTREDVRIALLRLRHILKKEAKD